jgi:hypothetical protein
LALERGVRKKPSVERGPKAINAIRLPKPMTSVGVRQLAMAVAAVLDALLMSSRETWNLRILRFQSRAT